MKRRHSPKNSRRSLSGYHCRGRIWIENNGETFLGFGRIILLKKIQEYGSISAAARSMKMSYKHAWDLIDSMNRQAGKPLVVTSKGGKGGGGSRLTEAGEEVINTFKKLQKKFTLFLEQETGKLIL